MSDSAPAWAVTDPSATNTPSPPSARTWDPEFTLKARPASGPVERERHSLAYELREAARHKAAQDDASAAATANAAAMSIDDDTDPSDSLEAKEAYRYERQYHEWYYAQHPRDPRVPPPLGKGFGGGPSGGGGGGQPKSFGAPVKDVFAQQQQSGGGSGSAASSPAGAGGGGVAHPLASLRPKLSSASKKDDAPVVAGTPPPLRGLGPVGPTAAASTGGEMGSGRGFGETSLSLGPGAADPLAAPDDALEGSAATWIDGLPLPSVVSKKGGDAPGVGAGGRRASHASSKGSSNNSGHTRRAKRSQPSPLLRQFKEESAAGTARTPSNTILSQSASGRSGPPAAAAAGARQSKTPPGTHESSKGGSSEALSLNTSTQEKAGGGTPEATGAAAHTTSPPPQQSSQTPPEGARRPASASKTPFDEPYIAPRGVWDLTAVTGHVVEFACDQEGSRLIQQLAEDSFALAAIFCEVHDSLPMLVSHQFGNYCAQRLLELGQPTHKLAVMGALRGRMAQLALDTYGCRVIQRALDTFTDDTVEEMVALAHELDTAIPDLVTDQNGNHVVQKMMDKLPPHKYGTTALISAFVGRMNDVGMHCYGCRVIQKLFETCGDGSKFAAAEGAGSPHAQSAKRAMDALVQDVLHHMSALVGNQFGNYVVQHMIGSGSRETRSKAIALLTPRIPELSLNKFSSNVVERLLHCATDSERDNIVAVLCSARTFSSESMPPIVDMTRDKFANYVIQRIVELATPAQKQTIVNAIVPHIGVIKATTYGVHILSRLERIGWIPQGSSGIAPSANGMGGGPMGGRGRAGGLGGRGGRGGGGRGGGRGAFGGPGGFHQDSQPRQHGMGHNHHDHHHHHHQHHHQQQQQQQPQPHHMPHGGYGATMYGGGGGSMQQPMMAQQQQQHSWATGANVGGGGMPMNYGGGNGFGNAHQQQQQHQQQPQHQHGYPVYAQQYASLQHPAGGGGGGYPQPQHQHMGGAGGAFGAGPQGGGGGMWGPPTGGSPAPPSAATQPPIDVSRFSTDDLLSALAFLQQQQQQRAMAGGGGGSDAPGVFGGGPMQHGGGGGSDGSQGGGGSQTGGVQRLHHDPYKHGSSR